MGAAITSIVSVLLGFLLGSLRFKREKNWEIKHEYYKELVHTMSEISTYAGNLHDSSIPVGSIITDQKEEEIPRIVFKNITFIRKNRKIYSIFLPQSCLDAIEDYLDKALRHNFNMSEEYGMWYDDDWQAQMNFETNNWGGHKKIADEALEKIIAAAKKDLSGKTEFYLGEVAKFIEKVKGRVTVQKD